MGLAIFTKIFALIILPVMLAYLLSMTNCKSIDKTKNILIAALGLIIAFLVCYIPIMISGELEESLTFFTMRTNTYNNNGFKIDEPVFTNLFAYVPLLIVVYSVLFLATLISKKNNENNVLWLIILSIVPIFSLPFMGFTPQYGLVLMPAILLLYCIKGRVAILPWLLLLSFVIHAIFYYWGALLYPLACFTNIIDETTLIFGIRNQYPELYIAELYTMFLSGFSIVCIFVKTVADKIVKEGA